MANLLNVGSAGYGNTIKFSLFLSKAYSAASAISCHPNECCITITTRLFLQSHDLSMPHIKVDTTYTDTEVLRKFCTEHCSLNSQVE